MKGTSKVIMGATLVMVVTLAMVLGLVLVLLAELYCSLLLRRRQLRLTSTNSSTTTAATASAATTTSSQPPQPQTQNQPSPPPLSSFYAHGVLHAPRSLLFPKLPDKEETVDLEKQHSSHLRQFLESHQTQESTTSPHQIGVVISSPPPPSPSFTPQSIQQVGGGTSKSNGCNSDGVCGSEKEQFVYISNPIYDNDARPSRDDDTPFETPDTSPSRLEAGGSSSDDNDGEEEIVKQSSSRPYSITITPPLTPMKKLPKEACSVSLRDARSLGPSGSDSNSNNGVSSSSSGTPCTSPSW